MKSWFVFAAAVTVTLAQPGDETGSAVREGSWWVYRYTGTTTAGGATRLKVNANCSVTVSGEAGNGLHYTLKYHQRFKNGRSASGLPPGMDVKVRAAGDWVNVTVPPVASGRDEFVLSVPRSLREARIE